MDLALLSGILGGAGVVFGMLRGRNQERRETDTEMNKRIDERIKLQVGEQLTRITTILEEVQRQLPAAGSIARDNQRIDQLEEHNKTIVRVVDECFKRLRDIEQSCASKGHA